MKYGILKQFTMLIKSTFIFASELNNPINKQSSQLFLKNQGITYVFRHISSVKMYASTHLGKTSENTTTLNSRASAGT